MVIWRAPQSPQIKLNTDGSFDRDTLISGGGGLIRDHLGRLMLAFHSSFRRCLVFMPSYFGDGDGDCKDARLGFHYDLDRVGRSAVVTTITSGCLGSWRSSRYPIRIRNIFEDLQYSISHIYERGNRPADHQAELGVASLGSHIVYEGTTSHHLLALIRMDQLRYPSFRF
ncbi:hypothetical protein DH2020_025578 [Rehmannia glutinosa]|uniref:RNase H type-1 domain-containing protein n=1 Tax=Rehmannia glutinosa TaxID=99300 RepID=A0ABR0W1Z4_REHGL